jgi:monoamine oxidase
MRPEDLADLEMAVELSLDVDSLTNVERRFMPPGETHRDEDFIAVRNALVVKWRQKPREYLTANAATALFKKKFHNLAVQAHAYLTMYGYINFGTMTRTTGGATESAFNEFKRPTLGERKLSVVVVGAGAAGLAAAKHLQNLGHDVVVVESRDCPGGRVRTEEFASTSTSTTAKVDLGASILSGSNGNPLCVLAKQLKLKPHVIRSVCPLFQPDGTPIDDGLDAFVEKKFNQILESIAVHRAALPPSEASGKSLGDELEKRVNKELEKMPSDTRGPTKDLFNWHIANLEFANAAKIRDLSLLHWDQDDEFDFTGNHIVVSGGNGQFIDSLAKNVTVWYEHAATGVTDVGALGTRGVIVHCGDKVDIMADCCVVTVPLGVLKKEIIHFVPALPHRKLQAIENINFGTLNKVVLVFPTKFWDEDGDTFGFVQHQTADRGRYFLIYSYSRDDNSLLALCAGNAAIEVEKLDEADVIDDLVRYLRSAYEKRGVKVPDPVSGRVTAWQRDEHTYGSYSSCSTTTTREDYDELAKPAGNVYFAGEATTCQYPATLHGAFLSGMREAGRIAVRDRFDEDGFDTLGEVTVTVKNDVSDRR